MRCFSARAAAASRDSQTGARDWNEYGGEFAVRLYYGYLGLVDGILERLVDELGAETRVIATAAWEC